MERSCREIIEEFFMLIKKAYIPLLKIFGVFLGGGILSILTIYLVMGKDFVSNMNNSAYVQIYLTAHPKYGIFMMLIFFFLLLLTYVSYAWTILVVRNNILQDKSLLKEAFFESLKKSWKVILSVILMGIAYFTVMSLVSVFFVLSFFKQQNAFLSIVIYILLMFGSIVLIVPSVFTIFTGMLCRDGKFWTIFWESFLLGFKKWFKITIYMLGVSIAISTLTSVVVGILFSIIFLLFKSSSLTILLNIPFYLSGFLSACFYTVLYLDLAGITSHEEVKITDEVIIDPADLDPQLRKSIDQKTTQPSDEKKEPPHMDVLK